jgi:hypothetical protein
MRKLLIEAADLQVMFRNWFLMLPQRVDLHSAFLPTQFAMPVGAVTHYVRHWCKPKTM